MRPKQVGTSEVKVYHDKETDAVDEYTAVVDGEDVIALSKHPNDMRGGFNQFAGSLAPKGKIVRDNLGERIRWDETPSGVREAIIDRLQETDPKRLMVPPDEEPPFTIDIVHEGGSGTDSGVETWHYEGNDLFVSYTNGDTIEYEVGNVVAIR